MARENPICCTTLCKWSGNDFWDTDSSKSNNSSCSYDHKNNNKSLCVANQQDNQNIADSAKIDDEEIKNIKQQLVVHKKRAECLLKINGELESELDNLIQSNLLMEQCVTCPYIVNKMGKINFPGKSDLDKRFDSLFEDLVNLKMNFKVTQNDNYLVRKLDQVLHLPLSRCPNNCHKNVNKE